MIQESYLASKWEMSIHNDNQFELFIDYKVNPEDIKSRFRLESYFFVPLSFRINEKTYPKERFYEDMQVYIRFKTILISLKKLYDPKNEISPWIRALNLVDKIRSGDISQITLKLIMHELKMTANIASNVVINEISSIEKSFTLNSSVQLFTDCSTRLKALTHNVQMFERILLGKREIFQSAIFPDEVRQTFDFLIEYFSLVVQRELTRILIVLEEHQAKHKDFNDISEVLRTIIQGERIFRIKYGFPSIINPGEENEEFNYRYGILKKFVSNVLYLTARPEKTATFISELGYASAAGIAMLIALIFTYFAQELFQQFTLPFIALIVVGYMVKDRTKEYGRLIVGKGFLGRRFNRRSYDYKSNIYDQQRNVIGKSSEKFNFLRYNEVNNEIIQLRNISQLADIEEEGKPQKVFKYSKYITLYPQTISKYHTRVLDASDILRYDISSFLSKIENPYTKLRWFNNKTNKIQRIKTARVYHLNVIVKFTSIDTKNNESYQLKRVRLILDKNGIKRIDEDFT